MNKQCISLAITVLVVSLSLSGCSSKITQTSQYSGFLPDYSKLQETTSPSGHKTLRWIDPNYKESSYRGLYFEPVVYFPVEKPTPRVSQGTLNQIKAYATQRIKSALETRFSILKTPAGPRVLVARVAITAVSAENEDMQFYEVVPVAAVVAGTMAATGHRAQNTTLYLEGKLIDQDRGKTVMEVVRKAYGRTISNDSSPVTAEDIKAALDDMVTDITQFPSHG